MWVDDLELIYEAPDDASIETTVELNHQVIATANGLNVKLEDFSAAKIMVYGLDGKIVYESAINSSNTQHNIPVSGTYIYRIIKDEQIATGKVVID